MKVTHSYELPFDSEYDWRVTTIQMVTDLLIKSAIDVMKEVEAGSQEIASNDRYSALAFALENGLFERISVEAADQASKLIKANL